MAGWKRPAAPAAGGIGAVVGLLLATQLAPPEDAARVGLPLAAVGAVLGVGWSFWRFRDDRCRIPWWLRGCGGPDKIMDTAGHSRPRRPCWGHPNGKPKRLVNLAVVLGQIVAGVVLVAVAVGVGRGGG